MKLLVVTQTVDTEDPALGFFVRWIDEFSKRVERVEVICLKEGMHNLSRNVHIHSLGKERGVTGRTTYALHFLLLVWRLRHEYDVVFVHMNPEYVVLAGVPWRCMGKRVAMWYTHTRVNLKLRIATMLSHKVLTASKESFRLPNKKVRVLGHGIDLALFGSHERKYMPDIRIISISRLSPTKGILEMFDVLDVLWARKIPFSFTLVGAPATSGDRTYARDVSGRIAAAPYHAHVVFLGGIPYKQLPALLARSNVALNLSATGSMDKAVLEAMAARVVPVTSNNAYRTLLAPDGLFVADATADRLADAVMRAKDVSPEPYRMYVEQQHALPALVSAILAQLRT